MKAGQATQPIESSLTIDAGIVTLRLVFEDKPWTVNERLRGTSRGSTFKFAALVEQWRGIFRDMAKGSPALLWCDVIVDHEKKINRLPDIGACCLAVKAAIDGIRDAGVIADDTPEYVRSHHYNPPVHTGRDALVITLIGPAA